MFMPVEKINIKYHLAISVTNLLSYYLANKRSLHVRSQSLEILTLIGDKNKNYPPLPLFGKQTEPPRLLLGPRNSHVNRRKKNDPQLPLR